MGEIKLGKGSYTSNTPVHRFTWHDVEVGKYCSIAYDLKVFTGGNHRYDWVTTYPFSTRFPFFNEFGDHEGEHKGITIGNDVWIGDNVVIMQGVTIGDGAVLGAHSVVRSSVGPYEMVRGNPARMYKKRFEQEWIDRLLEMKWWDWPELNLFEAMKYLCSTDVQGLWDYYQAKVKPNL